MRRIFAVAFLFFLLAEWGSHGLAFAHSDSGEGRSAHSREDGHDDPCKTMIRCSDGRQYQGRIQVEQGAQLAGIGDRIGQQLLPTPAGSGLFWLGIGRLGVELVCLRGCGYHLRPLRATPLAGRPAKTAVVGR